MRTWLSTFSIIANWSLDRLVTSMRLLTLARIEHFVGPLEGIKICTRQIKQYMLDSVFWLTWSWSSVGVSYDFLLLRIIVKENLWLLHI